MFEELQYPDLYLLIVVVKIARELMTPLVTESDFGYKGQCI